MEKDNTIILATVLLPSIICLATAIALAAQQRRARDTLPAAPTVIINQQINSQSVNNDIPLQPQPTHIHAPVPRVGMAPINNLPSVEWRGHSTRKTFCHSLKTSPFYHPLIHHQLYQLYPLYCSISLPSFRRHPCWVSHSILVGLKLLQQAPHSRIQQCQS